MTVNTDPAGHGAGRIRFFTVLYDEQCPVCRAAHRWLESRAQLVPLEFVPAASPEARARFPGLDHRATLRDLTVISDGGDVYADDGAWLACLWALADYRGMAERLSTPSLLPAARTFIKAASAVRRQTRGADYGDGCDDTCR
ncbi:DCC1-like thiol-disulfide oxidoreductase family protein [Actinoplanes sp. NBRC 103695]|uniref:thiol-disulfide oxidoreductase DCC family protein n=1 Tax=Actinoplanes sp. NBRC 103695 TaxID=3032202 RepID=UPI00255672E8|nr:DCC1-like thiol-disulfide oxidoreductase family protein [Actinoplanes sp. NBRC 103695]